MGGVILTPDQRIRVFVSSTLDELAEERRAVRRAVESLHLAPVMFELGARPHPPRALYRSYLEQSHIFVGLYWQRYGWVAPGMEVSGLEDEYLLATDKPRLVYVKRPAPEQEARLRDLLDRVRAASDVSYRAFATAAELEQLVADDLSMVLTEAYHAGSTPARDVEAPRRHRLPASPTPLVGRERELEDLQQLLGSERLVTLTGPGGIGKSRLASAVAVAVAGKRRDGAAFVSLASIQDARLVASAIAQTLGVREEGRDDALDALKEYLSERAMLLVLDNFEQVLPATYVVTELLEASPELRLVVTSREALRVLAEHEYPVASLPSSAAVELFARRAAAVRHGFAVDATNAAMVDRIVERLEGVPLAIELAAARLRVLPLEAILQHLDDALDFLSSGARDLPERQRALRTTLDWSYELLDDRDKRAFARLGVFVSTFSLDAARAVLDADVAVDVLSGLASLVDKSLLRAEPADGEPRFRMLAMVADYARERLAARGELDEARRRHATFYRDLSIALHDRIRGPEQASWVAHLGYGGGSGDIDNLRASLRWHIDRGEPGEVAAVVWSLWLLGWMSGRLEECRMWARQALAAPQGLAPEERARLLTVAGLMEMWSGEYRHSMPALVEAVELARRARDDDLLANALLARSLASSFVDGVHTARAPTAEALALFRASNDRWGEATAFSVLTWLYVAEDDYDTHPQLFDDALATAQSCADELNRAMIETNVAELRLHRGRHEEAAQLLAASVCRYAALRALYPCSYAIDGAARLAWRTGRPGTAAQLLGAADGLRRTIGVPVEGAHRARRNGLSAQVRDELGPGPFDDAVAQGQGLRFEEAVEAALALLRRTAPA